MEYCHQRGASLSSFLRFSRVWVLLSVPTLDMMTLLPDVSAGSGPTCSESLGRHGLICFLGEN